MPEEGTRDLARVSGQGDSGGTGCGDAGWWGDRGNLKMRVLTELAASGTDWMVMDVF